MKTNFRIDFLIYSIIFLSIFLLVKPVSAQFCQTSGWAWSDSSGWTSFNCEDYPPVSWCNGSDCCSGVECCSWGNWPLYGVKVGDKSDGGGFYDYAWNDMVGWIDFGPTENFPVGTSYPQPATLDFKLSLPPEDQNPPYEVNGWAQIYNYKSTESGGWISMSCKTDPSIVDKTQCDAGGIYENYKVTYNNCQFHGWAWSDDIGWISFNCDNPEDAIDCNGTWVNPNPPPLTIRIGDYYSVNCGEKPQPFEITSVVTDRDSSCSAINVQWEKDEDVGFYYDIYRRNENAVPQTITLIKEGVYCDADDKVCSYYDSGSGIEAKTEYSYRIIGYSLGCPLNYRESLNSFEDSDYTTICPPVITYPDNEAERIACCDALGNDSTWNLPLEWNPQSGGGSEFIVYQAIGGPDEVYQRTVSSSDPNPVPTHKECNGCYDIDGNCTCYVWKKESTTNTFWISPDDSDSAVEGDEDPFVFKPNYHYYYFVRAIDPDAGPNHQDVDSNRVEICCQQ